VLLGKVTNEQGNILGALAQRGDNDGEDVQSVVEVAAEEAVLNHLGKVAVSGGEDAQTLTREFATVLPASNLQDLPDYKTFIRTMSAERGRPGEPQGPIAVNTFPAFAPQDTENDKARVIQASLRRYSRPRAAVDAKLNKFLLS
jgi:hypothetical protein